MASKTQSLPPEYEQHFLSSPEVYGIPATSPAYVLVPLHRTRIRRPRCCTLSCCAVLIPLFVLLAIFGTFSFLWPSDPDIQIVRLNIDRIKASVHPIPYMDIWMHLRLKVRNPNFVSVDYEPAVTSIAYRGRLLEFATSGKTSVDSRGVSYVEATLRFNEIRVMQDVEYYFNDDLEKGIFPLDTTTEIDGTVQILLLSVPVKVISSSLTTYNLQVEKSVPTLELQI